MTFITTGAHIANHYCDNVFGGANGRGKLLRIIAHLCVTYVLNNANCSWEMKSTDEYCSSTALPYDVTTLGRFGTHHLVVAEFLRGCEEL